MSATTRVYPSVSWAASAMKNEIGRSFKRMMRANVCLGKTAVMSFVSAMLLLLRVMDLVADCDDTDVFTTEDLKTGAGILNYLTVGKMDKDRTNAYLA